MNGKNLANDPTVQQIKQLLAGGDDDGDQGADSRRDSLPAQRDKRGKGPRPDAQSADDADADDLEEDSQGPAGDDVAHDDSDGAASDDGDGGDDAPGDEAGELEGVTVAQLAQRLGVSAKDIYNDLLIPMGDGERMTLGQFKDRVRDLRELDTQREQFTEQHSEWEKGQLRDRAMLTEMINILGPDNARPLYEAAGRRLASWMEDQKSAVLEAIPEWQDTDALARDRKAIVKMGAEYGFSEVEMTHTHDARTVRMLRDFAMLRQQHDKPALNGKIKRAAPGRPGAAKINAKGGALRKAIAAAKSSSNNTTISKGVAAILQSEG